MAQPTPRWPTSDPVPASPSTSSTSADASSRKSFAFTELVKTNRVLAVSLAVGDGETLVILGPSGAGKTSLLRLLCGLEAPDSGRVVLDDRDITTTPPQRRRIALVSQHDSLFPHLTIYENLAFAMRLRGAHAEEIDRSVRDYAHLLEIDGYLRVRPSLISGGERQRAALARALLAEPRALLLDEPFAHLDPQLREHVRRQFSAARRRFAGPAIHVTHDHAEAMAIGDRLAILIGGRIAQYGVPQDVYDFPATVEVARFFGSPPMNLIDGEAEILGVRPEHVNLDDNASLRATLQEIEPIGPDILLRLRTLRGPIVARLLRDGSRRLPVAGTDVGVSFTPEFVRRFDRTSGTLIR